MNGLLISGRRSPFTYSGDPVTGTGWLYPDHFTGGGAGFVFFCGPFTLAANETSWTMIALVPALGTPEMRHIKHLRLRTELLKEMTVEELRGPGFTAEDTLDAISPVTPPSLHTLHPNYPNPFNGSTILSFDIAVEADVSIAVYNALGQKIRMVFEGRKSPGKHSFNFDAAGLPAGVYLCEMKVNYLTFGRKMLLLK